MAATHRSARRALTAAVLCLALLTAPLARAEDKAPSGRSVTAVYVVPPIVATVILVVVVALVQAARAPAGDVRPTTTALNAVDRALAAARSREVAYTTRWLVPLHQGRALAAAATLPRGGDEPRR